MWKTKENYIGRKKNLFPPFFRCMPIYAAEFYLTFGIPPAGIDMYSTRKRKRRNFIFYKRGIVRKERISLFFRLGCLGKERVVDEKFLSSQVCCLMFRERGGQPKAKVKGEKEKKGGNGASFAVKSAMLFLGLGIQQMFDRKCLQILKNSKKPWT